MLRAQTCLRGCSDWVGSLGSGVLTPFRLRCPIKLVDVGQNHADKLVFGYPLVKLVIGENGTWAGVTAFMDGVAVLVGKGQGGFLGQ